MLDATCECGDVTLTLAERPTALTSCNCSICRRYGALWAYFNEPLVSIACKEPQALVAYRREDRGALAFHHCGRCGCMMFHRRERRGGVRFGVNARMIEPTVLDGAPIRFLDGARDAWDHIGATVPYSAAAGGIGP